MGIFEYAFMRRALLTGILLALIVPCIGLIVVLKRLSLMGDALAHTSLAGVTAGLLFNINPIAGAMVACAAAALGIEAIRRRIPKYSEMAIAVIMSAGIGLAGVLSGFVRNAANFNSFLFGSIVSISQFEMLLVAGISAVVLLVFTFLYRELFYITLDERSARLSGVPVKLVNFIFTMLTAVTVSVAARTVGALIVSSLMVIPVACAMQLGRSYRQTLFLSVGFALVFTVLGLFLSYYVGLKPGGTIVLLGVLCLVLLMVGKAVWEKHGKKGEARS